MQEVQEDVLSIPNVNIIIRGIPSNGHLKVNQKGFSFKVGEKG